MNEQQKSALQTKIDEWRAKAQPVGPQHALWDVIFDAEALIAGRPTMLSGTPDEIFEKLVATV